MNGLRAISSAIAINTLNPKVKIVVPCDLVKKRLRHYGCRNNIHVIHHGCDDFFRGNQITNTIDSDKFLVLCVAGFAPGKNQQLLVEVFKGIEDKSKYRVILVGRPRLRKYFDYIKKCIHQNDLGNILEIQSDCSDDDLKKLYAQADLYVQPSTDEGFCLTALDAASQGLRVVGANVGEIANIAKLSGGIVAKYNNIESFRNAIVILASSKRNAYTNTDITDNYSWDIANKQLFDIYKAN
jgi:glycosyltransferase involved in cell wall biosynthesis